MSKTETVYTFKALRTPIKRRELTDDALGVKSVPDGFLVGDIEVKVDWDAIVRVMGAKALKAMSKTCRDGFITVKARNVSHEVKQ